MIQFETCKKSKKLHALIFPKNSKTSFKKPPTLGLFWPKNFKIKFFSKNHFKIFKDRSSKNSISQDYQGLSRTSEKFKDIPRYSRMWWTCTFFCISSEFSPINGSLKYLILISHSVFSELFSFLLFILSFKYDLTIWSINLRGYWFFWRIFLKSLRSLLKPIQELLILYVWSTSVLIKPSF